MKARSHKSPAFIRHFSKLLIVAGFILLVLNRVIAADSPNMVLILSDDHSYPHLSCYGDKAVKTPNLDRFASEGMRFERAFVSAPQCVPSRAAIMTGRSPVAVRITRFNSPLPPDVITLPELLRQKGYYTGICRRYFHLDGTNRKNSFTYQIIEKYQMRTFSNRVDYLDYGSPPNQTVSRVNEFLDKVPPGRPFFLWISFNDPHHPWTTSNARNVCRPEDVVVPPFLPDLPGIRNDLARYYTEIMRMDDEFQSVMDILEKRGLKTNTIVVFMGDNGFAFPHGKGSLYDPGINVPLIIRWQGKVAPGSVSRELISGEDIAPTLLEAAGIEVPKYMTGKSFLNLLLGKPFEGRKYIFAERGVHGGATFNERTKSNGYDLSRCVRSQRYKLIYNCTPSQQYMPVDSGNDPGWQEMVKAFKNGKLDEKFVRAYFTSPRPIFELYDLEKDPAELVNLSGNPDYAKIELELKQALQEKMILDFDYLPLPIQDY